MSTIYQFNQRVPIGEVGGVPVYASLDFLRYIEEQRLRSGGDTAPTNDDLARDLPEDAGMEEAKLDLFRLRDELGQLPPIQLQPDTQDQTPPGVFFTPEPDQDARLQALEAQLYRLAQEVEALKQGTAL
jgi:hypothetical protein